MKKTKENKQTTGVNNLTSLTQRPSKRSMLRRRIVLIRGAGHRRALVRSREHTAWTLFIPDVRTRAACVPKGGKGMKAGTHLAKFDHFHRTFTVHLALDQLRSPAFCEDCETMRVKKGSLLNDGHQRWRSQLTAESLVRVFLFVCVTFALAPGEGRICLLSPGNFNYSSSVA